MIALLGLAFALLSHQIYSDINLDGITEYAFSPAYPCSYAPLAPVQGEIFYDPELNELVCTHAEGVVNKSAFEEAEEFMKNAHVFEWKRAPGTYGEIVNASYVLGYRGYALAFNGSGYVEVPDSVELNPREEITVTAWIKWNPGRFAGHIVAVPRAGSYADAYVLWIENYNELHFGVNTELGFKQTFLTINNELNFIAGWFNGTHVCVQVNETRNCTYAGAAKISYDKVCGKLLVGIDDDFCENSPDWGFNGTIDEVRIWNRSLSAEEISELYHGLVPKKGLVLELLFDEGSGNIIYDTSKADLEVNSTYHYPYLIKARDGIYFGPKGGVWKYRRKITISNPNSYSLEDFQVRVELPSDLLSKAKADCSDLRFTDLNNYLLPYWVENCSSGIVWVKVPFIPAGSSTSIYVYYGNELAEDASCGACVFEFFDDFESYRMGETSPDGWVEDDWYDAYDDAEREIEANVSQVIALGNQSYRMYAYSRNNYGSHGRHANVNLKIVLPENDLKISGKLYVSSISSSQYGSSAGFIVVFYLKDGGFYSIFYRLAYITQETLPRFRVAGVSYLPNISLPVDNSVGKWITFERDLLKDFESYVGKPVESLNKTELILAVRADDGPNVGNTGEIEAYFDEIYARNPADIDPKINFGTEEPGFFELSGAFLGKFGGALQFNGSNYVQTDELIEFKNFTATFWLYPADNGKLLEIRNMITSEIDQNFINFSVRLSDGKWYSVTYPIEFGKWYFVSEVFKRGKLELYINGKLVNSSSLPELDPYSESGELCIGKCEGNSFEGYIDEFRIFNRALSSEELKELYKGARIESGLIVEYLMEKASIIEDSSRISYLGEPGKALKGSLLIPTFNYEKFCIKAKGYGILARISNATKVLMKLEVNEGHLVLNTTVEEKIAEISSGWNTYCFYFNDTHVELDAAGKKQIARIMKAGNEFLEIAPEFNGTVDEFSFNSSLLCLNHEPCVTSEKLPLPIENYFVGISATICAAVNATLKDNVFIDYVQGLSAVGAPHYLQNFGVYATRTPFNMGLYFNGSAYAKLNYSGKITGSLTAVFWINAERCGAGDGIHSVMLLGLRNDTSTLKNSWWFELWPDCRLCFSYHNGSLQKAVCRQIVPNRWHFVAGVINTTGVSLFIDNNLAGYTETVVNEIYGNATLRIGYGECLSGWGCYNGFFLGKIDEFRYYNRTLSTDEISQAYLQNPPEDGSIEIVEAYSTIIPDSSRNGNAEFLNAKPFCSPTFTWLFEGCFSNGLLLNFSNGSYGLVAEIENNKLNLSFLGYESKVTSLPSNCGKIGIGYNGTHALVFFNSSLINFFKTNYTQVCKAPEVGEIGVKRVTFFTSPLSTCEIEKARGCGEALHLGYFDLEKSVEESLICKPKLLTLWLYLKEPGELLRVGNAEVKAVKSLEGFQLMINTNTGSYVFQKEFYPSRWYILGLAIGEKTCLYSGTKSVECAPVRIDPEPKVYLGGAKGRIELLYSCEKNDFNIFQNYIGGNLKILNGTQDLESFEAVYKNCSTYPQFHCYSGYILLNSSAIGYLTGDFRINGIKFSGKIPVYVKKIGNSYLVTAGGTSFSSNLVVIEGNFTAKLVTSGLKFSSYYYENESYGICSGCCCNRWASQFCGSELLVCLPSLGKECDYVGDLSFDYGINNMPFKCSSLGVCVLCNQSLRYPHPDLSQETVNMFSWGVCEVGCGANESCENAEPYSVVGGGWCYGPSGCEYFCTEEVVDANKNGVFFESSDECGCNATLAENLTCDENFDGTADGICLNNECCNVIDLNEFFPYTWELDNDEKCGCSENGTWCDANPFNGVSGEGVCTLQGCCVGKAVVNASGTWDYCGCDENVLGKLCDRDLDGVPDGICRKVGNEYLCLEPQEGVCGNGICERGEEIWCRDCNLINANGVCEIDPISGTAYRYDPDCCSMPGCYDEIHICENGKGKSCFPGRCEGGTCDYACTSWQDCSGGFCVNNICSNKCIEEGASSSADACCFCFNGTHCIDCDNDIEISTEWKINPVSTSLYTSSPVYVEFEINHLKSIAKSVEMDLQGPKCEYEYPEALYFSGVESKKVRIKIKNCEFKGMGIIKLTLYDSSLGKNVSSSIAFLSYPTVVYEIGKMPKEAGLGSIVTKIGDALVKVIVWAG